MYKQQQKEEVPKLSFLKSSSVIDEDIVSIINIDLLMMPARIGGRFRFGLQQ
jgi:hypothetical protein